MILNWIWTLILFFFCMFVLLPQNLSQISHGVNKSGGIFSFYPGFKAFLTLIQYTITHILSCCFSLVMVTKDGWIWWEQTIPFSHAQHLSYSVKHTFHRMAHISQVYRCSRFPFNHDAHLPYSMKHTFHRMAHSSQVYRCSRFPFNHNAHLPYSVKHTFHRMAHSSQVYRCSRFPSHHQMGDTLWQSWSQKVSQSKMKIQSAGLVQHVL